MDYYASQEHGIISVKLEIGVFNMSDCHLKFIFLYRSRNKRGFRMNPKGAE